MDTSAFSDPRLKNLLESSDLDSTMKAISALIAELRFKLDLLFYTTPSMANEMRKYLLSNGVSINTVNDLFAWIIVKAPDMLTTKIPAVIMNEYISSIRLRTFRGLRLLEDLIKRAIASNLDKLDKNKVYAELIHEAREKYREIMRKGIVDSPEDFDVIILAYELKGTLVTNDEGIKRLAEKMGIIVIDPITFIEGLKKLKIMLSG
ncbi:MAG: RNA ligase partner protein [Fervidicoccaceae archaeon]